MSSWCRFGAKGPRFRLWLELPNPELPAKGTPLGTPNREPQEYSRNIVEYKDPGRYIPIIYLLYSWGSLFGVPSRVPLLEASPTRDPKP